MKKRFDDARINEPTKLKIMSFGLEPGCMGRLKDFSCINVGGESVGLAVVFIGEYVENEDITFTDVTVSREIDEDKYIEASIELQKIKLPDGQWAYFGKAPNYQIPSRVNDNLKGKRYVEEEDRRAITVYFRPHGNQRKILDITVGLIPLMHQEGQVWWNVWYHYGSKKAFLEKHIEFKNKYAIDKSTIPSIDDFDY